MEEEETSESLSDIASGLDLAHLHEALTGLVEGLRDDGSRLGLTLGPDDGCLAFLFRLCVCVTMSYMSVLLEG